MLEVKDWSFTVGKGYTVKVSKDETTDSFQVLLAKRDNYINSWIFDQSASMIKLNSISREILHTANVKDHETINAFIGSFIQMNSPKPFVNYMGDKLIVNKTPKALTAVTIDEGPAVILDSEDLYNGEEEE